MENKKPEIPEGFNGINEGPLDGGKNPKQGNDCNCDNKGDGTDQNPSIVKFMEETGVSGADPEFEKKYQEWCEKRKEDTEEVAGPSGQDMELTAGIISKENIPLKEVVECISDDDIPIPCDIQLEAEVFPSSEKTIRTCIRTECDKEYGGAHFYKAKNCLGFEGGKTVYDGGEQKIQFVQKEDNGRIIPGLQDEQLLEILIDRNIKLNRRFPSPQNEKKLAGLRMALSACRERVQERLNRGVMGKLKK